MKNFFFNCSNWAYFQKYRVVIMSMDFKVRWMKVQKLFYPPCSCVPSDKVLNFSKCTFIIFKTDMMMYKNYVKYWAQNLAKHSPSIHTSRSGCFPTFHCRHVTHWPGNPQPPPWLQSHPNPNIFYTLGPESSSKAENWSVKWTSKIFLLQKRSKTDNKLSNSILAELGN